MEIISLNLFKPHIYYRAWDSKTETFQNAFINTETQLLWLPFCKDFHQSQCLALPQIPESHLSTSPQRGAVFYGLIWRSHEFILLCNLHNKRVWLYNEMHGNPGATSHLIQIPLIASIDVNLYQPRMWLYLPLGRKGYTCQWTSDFIGWLFGMSFILQVPQVAQGWKRGGRGFTIALLPKEVHRDSCKSANVPVCFLPSCQAWLHSVTSHFFWCPKNFLAGQP